MRFPASHQNRTWRKYLDFGAIPGPAAAVTRWAIDAGARIVDRSPIAGSMVVESLLGDLRAA